MSVRSTTNRRVRESAAALLAAACLATLAAPAFASGGPGPSGADTAPAPAGAPVPPPTEGTRAPRPPEGSEAPGSEPSRPSTSPPANPAATTRGNVTTMIDGLVSVLQASKLDAATRDALVARLLAAKAAAADGHPLESAAMQALIRDVRAALGAPKGGGDRTKGQKPAGAPEEGTAEGGDDGTEDPAGAPVPGKDGVLRLLDSATAKVNASTLTAEAKQALLDQIAALRAKVDAGTPLGHEELGQLITAIRAAIGGAGGHGDEHKGAHPEDAGKKPGDRALAEIDRQIARVQASDLPDDVKAKVLAALEDAKAKIAAGAPATDDGGAAARQAIEDHRKQKVDELSARLRAVADKLDAKVAALAATPGNEALVADAQAKLAQARDLLTLSATPADLRAAWTLLRDVRRSIAAVEHPATTTTAAAPEPSTVPSTEAPTTTTIAG